jgi:hypothetical protein
MDDMDDMRFADYSPGAKPLTHYRGVPLLHVPGYWWHDWGDPKGASARLVQIDTPSPSRKHRRAWVTARHDGRFGVFLADDHRHVQHEVSTPEEAINMLHTMWLLGEPT